MGNSKYYEYTQQIIYYFLLLALFTFTFSLVSNPFLFAMPLIAFLGFNFKKQWEHIKSNGAVPFIIALFVYILIETVAYFTSGNLLGELPTYSTKLLLFFLPLSLVSLPRNLFSPKRIKHLVVAYVGGCALYVFVTLGYGAWRVIHYDKINYIFYTLLSEWKHPTFIASMLLFSNVIIYYFCFVRKKKLAKATKICFSILIALQSVYILLLQSKTLLIALFILFVAMCFHLYRILSRRTFFTGMLALLLSVVAFVQFLPENHNRFQNMVSTLLHNKTVVNNSTSYRFIAIQSSCHLVMESPLFGHGLTASKQKLSEAAAAQGIHQELKPHNQYLHTAMQTGIVGLFSLLAVLGSVLYCCKGRGKILYFALTYLFIFCWVCMFESCWEHITMVTYSAVFLSLLVLPLETRRIMDTGN